jgi:hypothetical protein
MMNNGTTTEAQEAKRQSWLKFEAQRREYRRRDEARREARAEFARSNGGSVEDWDA